MAILRKQQERGCRGIDYGGNPTVLDCMIMLKEIWDGDTGKYISSDGIMRCWRKADILPITWNADINNEVGSGSLHGEKFKLVSKEASDELCFLMSNIQLQVSTGNFNSAPKAIEVFQDSFATDSGLSNEDLGSIADVWINVEDDPEIIDAIVDDELNEIENVPMVCDGKDELNDENDEDPESINATSIKNHTHQEAMQALEVLRSYVKSNHLKLETLNAVSKLSFDIQSHYMKKPKTTKSIVAYFENKN